MAPLDEETDSEGMEDLEGLESTKKDKKTPKSKKATKTDPKSTPKKEEKKKKKREVVRKLRVDLWRTRFHGEKVGIRQDAQHRHEKGFQWSKDMDPLGEVKEDGKSTRLIGIRKGLWEDDDDEDHNEEYERRLIIKTFTKSSWVGTIEELTASEIKNSAATGKDLPAFICLLSGAGYTVPIEQTRSIYGRTFSLTVETENREFEPMRIRERRFTFGSDWDVYILAPKKEDEKVAFLDGKFMNVGGAWDIGIYDPDLAKNREFVESMILFCASIRFHKEIRKKIEKTINAIEKGKYQLKVEKQEYDLMKNPRIKRV